MVGRSLWKLRATIEIMRTKDGGWVLKRASGVYIYWLLYSTGKSKLISVFIDYLASVISIDGVEYQCAYP